MSEMSSDYAGFKAWIENACPEIPYDPKDDERAIDRRRGRYGLRVYKFQSRITSLPDVAFVAFLRAMSEDRDAPLSLSREWINEQIKLRVDLKIIAGELDPDQTPKL